ncbi:MAG: hypothetical protein WCF16_12620 [Alphaproteobacteria bacterium]
MTRHRSPSHGGHARRGLGEIGWTGALRGVWSRLIAALFAPPGPFLVWPDREFEGSDRAADAQTPMRAAPREQRQIDDLDSHLVGGTD